MLLKTTIQLNDELMVRIADSLPAISVQPSSGATFSNRDHPCGSIGCDTPNMIAVLDSWLNVVCSIRVNKRIHSTGFTTPQPSVSNG